MIGLPKQAINMNMNWQTELEHEQAFLRHQIEETDHKIARLRHASEACQDCLESEGLDKRLRSAQAERDLLGDLLERQSGNRALSLDVLVLQREQHYRHEIQRLARHWGRGEPTPPGYWEAESKYAILTDLLRRYHAWQAGRPLYPQVVRPRSNGTHLPKPAPVKTSHPWFIGAPDDPRTDVEAHHYDTPSKADDLTAQRDTLLESLHRINYPEHHLEIIVQPDGLAYVTGYAHSSDERDQALAVLFEQDEIGEVLVDIKVIPQAMCPVCHAQRPPAP
jgi:hypothetical protein